MDNFTKYERMRDEGANAVAVYLRARDDGIDPIARVRMLRAVFAIDLVQAKRAIDTAESSPSDELLAALMAALETEE